VRREPAAPGVEQRRQGLVVKQPDAAALLLTGVERSAGDGLDEPGWCTRGGRVLAVLGADYERGPP
jgi:hypothetical protein